MSKANTQAKREIAAMLETFMAKYPAVFSERRPLARGVHRQILAEIPGSGTLIRAAIRRWVRGTRYLKALSKGGPRYGLDGQPCGEVTEVEQADALARLQQRRERCQPKKPAAAVEQPQQVAA